MNSYDKIVIFDIGDTLTKVSKFKSFTYFGNFNKLSFIFKYFTKNKTLSFEDFKNNITNFYVDILAKIPTPFSFDNTELKTINGKAMPALQRDYFLGRLSFKDCIEIGDNWLKNNKDSFTSKIELEIFKEIFHFNFEPETFVKSQKSTKCMELLKKCFVKKKLDGNRQNFVIILSNMPSEIVPYLRIYFPEIYQFSDIQLFSCEQGYVKPNSNLFDKCLSYCNKNQPIFYIDDELFQRQTAECYDIKSIDPMRAEMSLKEFEVI